MHHLLFGDERVVDVGFAKEKLSTSGNLHTNQFSQLGGIRTNEVAIEVPVVTGLVGGVKASLVRASLRGRELVTHLAAPSAP